MSVLGMNEGTQKYINFDLVGTTNTQVVGVGYGTVSTVGTLPNLPQGSINVTAGTITAGTLTNLVSGTINSATVTGNIGVSSGTVNVSTISSLPNIPGGTLGTITGVGSIGGIGGTVIVDIAGTEPIIVEVGTIAAGTINLLKAGTITRLEQGSINVTSGTVNTGTINIATIVGPTAVGAASTTFPLFMGARDTGGTMQSLQVEAPTTPNLRVSLFSGGTLLQALSPVGDGQGTGVASLLVANLPTIFNGVSYDRMRSINTANGGTGIGVLAAGLLGIDTTGTSHQIITDTGGTIALPNVTLAGGTVQNLVGGTIGVVSQITNGSIVVTAGTVAAHAITAATITEGTLRNLISGTINSATVTGNVGISSGTINVGTIDKVSTVLGVGGTVSVDIVAGEVIGAIGTINSGTLDLLKAGTITRIEGGSITVTAGTFIGAGGSIIAYGAGGTGVAAVGNPLVVAGTDSGGSVYGIKVTTTGQPQINVVNGSIAVTAGTGIVTGGSIVITAGTVVGGTLQNLASGTINSATITGNVGVSSGTINVSTISALPNIPGGSIVVTAGTIGTVTNIGSIGDIGTLHVGTVTTTLVLNNGTIDLLKAGTITKVEGGSIAVTAGTFVGAGGSIISYGAGGTGVVAVGNPLVIAGTDSGGTTYGLKVTTTGQPQVNVINGSIAVTAGTEVVTGGSIVVTAGTVVGGTLQNLVSGTINSATVVLNSGTINVATATVGTVPGIGTLTNLGSITNIGMLHGGTVVTTMGDLTGGTIDLLSAGTISMINAGTVDLLKAGTITKLEGGTLGILSQGSINVTAGTIGGKAASGAAAVANPVLIAGTDSGGTVYAPLISAAGAVSVTGASAGTYVNVVTGTQQTLGTVGVLNSGTINSATVTGNLGTLSMLSAGTVTNVGSVVGVGILTAGTISMLNAGTVTSVGTIPGVGVVSALTVGTVGGKAASGAAAVANPILIAGTDAGGTVYAPLVTSAGAVTVTGASAGTYVNIVTGTQQTLGTVGVVSVLTKGTIALGTVVGAAASAAAASGGPVQVGGTDAGGTMYAFLTDTSGHLKTDILTGTIQSSGTTTGVGVLSMLTAGTVSMINAGTITSVGTVPGIGILTAGTISMINAGTITSVGSVPGVGVVTSLSGGTITKLEGGTLGILSQGSIQVTAGTITHGTIDIGTVKYDGRVARNVLTYGTTFGGTGAGYATLVGSAVVGAGTSTWINELSVINSKGGTVTGLIGFGTVLNGTSVLAKGDFGPQGGIQKSYPLAVNSGMTNQDLVAYIGGAGTLDFNVSYFIST